MDYSKIGLTNRFRRLNSLSSRPSEHELAIKNDINEEKNPIKQNIIITKQLYQSTLGGSVEIVSKEGGTVILSYDPETGTIVLNGGILVQQTMNLGTTNNSLFTNGTIQNSAFVNGTLGSVTLSQGTINNSTFGTPNTTGGTFNNITLGGIPFVEISIGSQRLGLEGALQFQTRSGTLQLAVRSGTNCWYFLPAGTQ